MTTALVAIAVLAALAVAAVVGLPARPQPQGRHRAAAGPWTAEHLWNIAWPEVPYGQASPADRRLYEAHADSLNLYHYGQEPR